MSATAPPPSPSTFRAALAALDAAQKPSYGAPAYSVLINRRVGRYLAAAAFRLHLTPNIVTGVSAMFSYLAIACLALFRPGGRTAVLVTGGLLLGYALDSADGQLARLRGAGTRLGEWLDHMVDAAKISSLHLAVLICAYRFLGLAHPAWLLVPVGYALTATVMFFGMILTEQLRRDSRQLKDPPASKGQWIRSVAVLPTDYGLLCSAFLLLAVAHAFLIAYTVLFACNVLFLLLAIGKWTRDMKAIDAFTVDPLRRDV